MMVRHETAWAAKINGNAYRDFLRNNPDAQKITLTRPQMEAIIRDLCEYSDRDAEATAWAEQATRSAARIAELEKAAEEVTDAWLNGVDSYLEAPMRALMALIWPQEPRSDAVPPCQESSGDKGNYNEGNLLEVAGSATNTPAVTPKELSSMLNQSTRETRTCLHCSNPFVLRQPNQIYCSRACRAAKARQAKVEGLAIHASVSKSTRGAIAELAVCVDLMRRGFDVYRALSPACPCDLVAIYGMHVVRVEVKSAILLPSGLVSKQKLAPRQIGRCDVLASVSQDGVIDYDPEIPEVVL